MHSTHGSRGGRPAHEYVDGMVAEDVQQGIAEYLESLTKRTSPAKAVADREAIKAIKDQIKSASDPIARLNLARELREASQPRSVEPSPHPGLAVFVEHGKAWADENGYAMADLQRYAKVPADVLREAGFTVPRPSERQKPSPRTRAPRLDAAADVLPVAKKLGDTFKVADLAREIERDVTTTRNYVNRLVADGLLVVMGEDSSGTGRPAKIYQVK